MKRFQAFHGRPLPRGFLAAAAMGLAVLGALAAAGIVWLIAM